MFRTFKIGLLAFVLLGTIFQSCTKDKCSSEITYQKFTPVYLTADEIRQPIQNLEAKELVQPGKIYIYNNYILVNEKQEGVHVIDNSNPESPQNVGFISIKGNIDIAVKDGILYADNYMDLLAIDITNPTSAQLISRTNGVFEESHEFNPADQTYLCYFERQLVNESVSCNTWDWRNDMWNTFEDGSFGTTDLNSSPSISGANFSASGSNLFAISTSVAGSMSRFVVKDNHLYTVGMNSLVPFDISNPAAPSPQSAVEVGFGLETVYPSGDYLFIGSRNGMFIYDISNPALPYQRSVFEHATACDPVYVDGNHAYVTLRSGNLCNTFNNRLDVLDVSNIDAPVLERSFNMDHPHGLSISNDYLFLCEGQSGLKIFDKSEPSKVGDNQLAHLKNFFAFDVISFENGLMVVVGEDGLYQYDYSNMDDIKALSVIPVTR